MLEALISSRTRMKLLLRFFVNPGVTAYLRGLAEEFQESTNAIRIELNRFEDAGMIISNSEGNKKLYRANRAFPLSNEIQSMLHKHIGLDRIIQWLSPMNTGADFLYLGGTLAGGLDTGIIDLIFVGDPDRVDLARRVCRAEEMVDRKLRYLIYKPGEWKEVAPSPHVLLWSAQQAGLVV